MTHQHSFESQAQVSVVDDTAQYLTFNKRFSLESLIVVEEIVLF